MLYLTPPSTPKVRELIRAGVFGWADSPRQGNKRPEGVKWQADNGCFSKRFDEGEWWGWLSNQSPDGCLLAVAPDVVGDAQATLVRSVPWLSRIRGLGMPAAFVGQDGLEECRVPWEDFDVFFIGGGTQWKLSNAAHSLADEAKQRGKWLHMGRVNSLRRMQLAKAWGCDSVDGTCVTFGPDVNIPKLTRYVENVANQGTLWGPV